MENWQRESRGLDPSKVPTGLEFLIPTAEEWGIGDDGYRAEAVDQARLDDLRRLVDNVDSADDDVLYGWLAGPAAQDPNPTHEYLTYTCMTMAADAARLRLSRS
ncbi:MAG: hypothetical protein QOG14_670 [Mycobacterium sp.]|jgi:hypothetical protein|nr:hypothetical protein [Mycobacterium sp.]